MCSTILGHLGFVIATLHLLEAERVWRDIKLYPMLKRTHIPKASTLPAVRKLRFKSMPKSKDRHLPRHQLWSSGPKLYKKEVGPQTGKIVDAVLSTFRIQASKKPEKKRERARENQESAPELDGQQHPTRIMANYLIRRARMMKAIHLNAESQSPAAPGHCGGVQCRSVRQVRAGSRGWRVETLAFLH